MGTEIDAPWSAGAWQEHLADAITDFDELFRLLDLGDSLPTPTPAAWRRFPLRVPRGSVARMGPGDVEDPFLHQVLSVTVEGQTVAGFTFDRDVRRALAALTTTGVILLNQAVLLDGVNDEVAALADLWA